MKATIRLRFGAKPRYPVPPAPHLSPASPLALILSLKTSQEVVVLRKSQNGGLELLYEQHVKIQG